ncbi:unnamed protein product [Ascophyllum nodosum]
MSTDKLSSPVHGVGIGGHPFASRGNLTCYGHLSEQSRSATVSPPRRSQYNASLEGVREGEGEEEDGDGGEASDRVSRLASESFRGRGGWVGESFLSSGGTKNDSPQSMLLTSDQNAVMRMPNFASFMDQQKNLQALLVDIHEDPEGFTSFVKYRRRSLTPVSELAMAALNLAEAHLSDYKNISKVGQGRFSTVFYAEHKVTGMPRAIKRIQLSDVSDESHDQRAEKERKSKQHRKRGHQSKGTRHGTGDGSGGLRPGEELGRGKKGKRKVNEMTYEMCLKEVGLLNNLTNPNIVRLDTCFMDKNVLWVVMEWVDGGDLKGVITRTKHARERLSELTVWGYFTQICDALLYMHSQRIMHRDLKPANILVCMDGTVKLGDLGLGRYLHSESVLAMSQVGTPLYMSPETLQGQGHELVSDIWSLGCVLYELAMLSSPFASRHLTLDKLFAKIVRADYLPVDRHLYSERLSNLVDHLLLPDPSIRPKIDMVQPAAHLALQAQRNGVEGLDVEELAKCADQIYSSGKEGGTVACAMTAAPAATAPPAPTTPPHEGHHSSTNNGDNLLACSDSCAWPETLKPATASDFAMLTAHNDERPDAITPRNTTSSHGSERVSKESTKTNHPNPPSPAGRGRTSLPPPNNTPITSVERRNAKGFWGKSRDVGGGEQPADGYPSFAGMKRRVPVSALSKSHTGGYGDYGRRLLEMSLTDVLRRHSYSGCEIAAT